MLASHHGRIGSIIIVKDWGNVIRCHPAAAYLRLKGNVCFQDAIPELIEKLLLFLAKGNLLAKAFKEYEGRLEHGMEPGCPTCDFMLASEGVYSIQKSEEFIQKISRAEAEKILKEVGLTNVWQEFREKIPNNKSR